MRSATVTLDMRATIMLTWKGQAFSPKVVTYLASNKEDEMLSGNSSFNDTQRRQATDAEPRSAVLTCEVLARVLKELSTRKHAWVQTSIAERIALLEHCQQDFLGVMERWVALGVQHKQVQDSRHAIGQEWGGGPYQIIRMLLALRKSLQDIEQYGAPRAAGAKLHQGTHGPQLELRMLPATSYDRVTFMGTTADVRLQPGITPDTLSHYQARAYRHTGEGKIALVLGAGNMASIPVTDMLERLFVEGSVVLLKMNPVNTYLTPLLEEAFGVLIDRGFLRVVEGGAEVGAYLCQHPLVDTIHITGSGKTFDAIVFGPGEEGQQRKKRQEPILQKPITAELGDVSPVIVVPGPWNLTDVHYQAHHLAALLASNGGFTCATPRLIVQHAQWSYRWTLLEALERALAQVPTRVAYYPGAKERWRMLVEAHPEAKQLGEAGEGALPWTLIPDLDPEADDICFELEPFCSLMSETALTAEDPAAFLDNAVTFVNERLWGSLSATILVHPASVRDPNVAKALERAIDNLRYGTVSINCWTGISWGLGTAPWGGYAGGTLHDARSGIGFTHNPLMLEGIEKTVMRAPFRSFPPPAHMMKFACYDTVIRQLTHLTAKPNPMLALRLMGSAVRGWL